MNDFEGISDTAGLRKRLRSLLLSGALPPGSKLPGARTLARDCGIHYQTVNRIYRELTEQGLAESCRGKGTLVRRPNYSGIRLGFFANVEKVTERSHMFYRNEALDAASEQAIGHGAALEKIEIDYSPAISQAPAIKKALKEYDGLIVCEENLPGGWPLFQAAIPVILYMGSTEAPLAQISCNSRETLYRVTSELIAKGKKRIALLSIELEKISPQRKLAGYVQAMRDAGLPIGPDFLWEFPSNRFFDVARDISKRLKTNKLFDAYICTGTNQGVLLLEHLRRNGVAVPEETSIIAYDEFDNSEDMSRVILPRREAAQVCVDRLLEYLGGPMPPFREYLPAVLHCGSTG